MTSLKIPFSEWFNHNLFLVSSHVEMVYKMLPQASKDPPDIFDSQFSYLLLLFCKNYISINNYIIINHINLVMSSIYLITTIFFGFLACLPFSVIIMLVIPNNVRMLTHYRGSSPLWKKSQTHLTNIKDGNSVSDIVT